MVFRHLRFRMWAITLTLLISLNGYTQNNNPVTNYNTFIRTLNEQYGMFPQKKINWDSLCAYYGGLISPQTTEDTLFFTMCKLASHLRDKHLWIDNEKFAYNYSLGKIALTSQMDSIFAARRIWKDEEVIKHTYLNKSFFSSSTDNIIAGKVDRKTGYISLDWFDGDLIKSDSAITQALKSLSGCNNLIVDIRNNRGGTDSSSLLIANYLVSTNHCYQISKIRDNSNVSGYSEPIYWHTNPVLKFSYQKIVVLINRYTISAAETFCLALKDQPGILFLGEPSAGAFSDAADAFLPNGWHFSYSIGVWTDCHGELWEEKGIQPDMTMNIADPRSEPRDAYMDQALLILHGR